MSEIAEQKYTAGWAKPGERRVVDRYALGRLIDLMIDDQTPEGRRAFYHTTLAEMCAHAVERSATLAIRAKRKGVLIGCGEAAYAQAPVELTPEQRASAIGRLDIAYEIHCAPKTHLLIDSIAMFAKNYLPTLAALGIFERKKTIDTDAEYYLMTDALWPWLKVAAETTNDMGRPINP